MAELVALEGPPGPAWVDELKRWWARGDAVLPVDHRLPPQAVAALYEALGPTLIATTAGAHRRHPGRPAEAGDALVLATSGTTGAPKGVVLTHDAVAAAARATSDALSVDPGRDTWICCLPLAHAGGLGVVTRALLTGTPLVVLPGFDADAVTAAARTATTTPTTTPAGAPAAAPGRRALVSLVATALRRVEPSVFGVILLGGDAPPDWPDGRPDPVVVTYGMTETGGGCVYDGYPLPGVEVDLSAAGEVLLRGPVLGRAYRTATGDIPLAGPDGWLATGDGGRLDPDGRLVVDGRLDDVIVTGGDKVWPTAVEHALRGCPGVEQVAVIGRPDPEWGQRVVALVVPAAGTEPPTLADLRAAARRRLGPWAAPKELELVTALPLTALGKVRRTALRWR